MKKSITFFKKRPILYSVSAVIIIVCLIYFINSRNTSSAYQFITVDRGSITQEVTVTGNTTPVSSVNMAFQNGGTIIAVNYNIGARVNAGDVVVRLDTSSLQAQLAQVQANIDTQKANLASLEAGATQQDIQVSQTAVATAQQSLTNDYMNVSNIVKQAYSEANDAVRNQLAPLFNTNSGGEISNPTLTFQVSDPQVPNIVGPGRVQAAIELNNWQTELRSINSGSSTSTLDTALNNAGSHLNVIQSFLIEMMTAVNDSRGLSQNTAAYQVDVTAATNEVNTAITSVNTSAQTIASQKAVVQQQMAALNLKLAGSTPQAIQAQQAEVEQAEASVRNIQVSISETSLVAPISGVITVQNAKIGEIVSPGGTVFSIISDNNLEVDSEIPEVDIGRVNVGDIVDMTIDALPGEQFIGKVFYIDPAQTIVQGVVDYLVKVSFDKSDPRIKSGLTVNLNIKTQTDNNVLIVPQFAVIQNSSGAFVKILKNNSVVQVPVTLGIQDDKGNVEIISGVTEGEQVLNIGLKQ
jgi:HlyD family secretion protein